MHQPVTKFNIIEANSIINGLIPWEYDYNKDLVDQKPFLYYNKDGDTIVVINMLRTEIIYNVIGLYYTDVNRKHNEILNFINANLDKITCNKFVMNVNPIEFIWDIDNNAPMTQFVTCPPKGTKTILMYGKNNNLLRSSSYSGVHNALWLTKSSSGLIKQEHPIESTCFTKLSMSYFSLEMSVSNLEKIILEPGRTPPSKELLKHLKNIKYSPKKETEIEINKGPDKELEISLAAIIESKLTPAVKSITNVTIDVDIEQIIGLELYTIMLDSKGNYYALVDKIPEDDKLAELLGTDAIVYSISTVQ